MINNNIKYFNTKITVAIFAFTLLFCNQLQAQFNIQITAPTFADSTASLSQYFGYNETNTQKVTLDKKGKSTVSIKGDRFQGIYTIRIGHNEGLDFLVGAGKSVHLQIDRKLNLTVKGNQESEAFEALKNYLTSQNIRKSPIIAKIQNPKSTPEEVKKSQTTLKLLNDSVLQYFDFVAQKHPTSTLSCYTNMLKGYQASSNLLNPRQAAYQQKNHFFDQLELQNPALVNAPFFPSKLNEYLNQILEPIPDTLIKYSHKLITTNNLDTTNRRFIVQYLLSFSTNSNIMGIDKMRIFVAEKYLLGGFGGMLSESNKQKIRELIAKSKPLIIGSVAPELKLNSFDNVNEIISLHDYKYNYTILLFWEPGCSFCKRTISDLKVIFEKLKSQNIGVFAVNTTTKDKEWRDYVIDNKLFDWVHAYDKTGYSTFRQRYDISVTPKIFLLDKEKRILAKDLDAQTIGKVLEHVLKTGSVY